MKITKSDFRRSCRASSPSASRTLNGAPAARGGVCGSSNAMRASAADPAAEICIGNASLSACSTKPTRMPEATIHPSVPKTRMMGKSRVESVTLCSEIELVSDSVGM